MKYATRVSGAIGTGLLALALVAGVSAELRAAPAKLTMVGSWPPKVSSAADIGIKYLETVNKLAKGEIEIAFKGSRDVVPTFDQPEALVRGLFDVWYGAPNYWAGVVPGGYFSELSPYEIPDNGPGSELFAFIVKMFERHGVRYLGHFSGEPDTGNHFLYTQKKISGIGDLKGRKIRVPPLTRFFVKNIGAEPVTLPPSEVYLALERGTVEGFTWPYYDGFTAFGWHKISKFVIAHPLYRDGVSVKMNLAKWNKLSGEAQKTMLDAVSRTQAWSQGWVSAYQAVQLKDMLKGGMKLVTFSDQEAAHWQKTAGEALWAQFKSVMSADEYATARRLLGYK
jgi:TRAP-type mannitol/chloroaromatic compound transport system substrate-binding protein